MPSPPASNRDNNKVASIGVGAIAGTVGALVLAPVLVPAALGIIGFGSAGVVGGSIAAGIQAGIGNVAAGSLFAVAQSIGAGGALPAVIYAAAGAMGAAAGAGATAANQDSNHSNANEPREDLDDANRGGYEKLEKCYICGSKQHDGAYCPNEASNRFLTKQSEGVWCGPNGERVCLKFNKRSKCRNADCKLGAHVCSRCGSAEHNAQKH